MLPAGLDRPEAQLLQRLMAEHSTAYGDVAPSPLSLRETLLQQVNAGTIKLSAQRDAQTFLEQGLALIEDTGITAEEASAVAATSVIKEHQRIALEKSVDAFSKGEDLLALSEQIVSIQAIGIAAKAESVDFVNLMDRIATQRRVRRIDTGIDDLDMRLGGIQAGTETVFVGGPGAGKSVVLSQVSAHAMLLGLNVLIATLEVSTNTWSARLFGALTGTPVTPISDANPQALQHVKEELLDLAPLLGHAAISYFTPQATTVSELLKWVQLHERKWRQPVDVLVVDYADKLAPENKKDTGSSYEGMREVYEKLRVWAEQRGSWVFTASQAKGRGQNNKTYRLDVDDCSDSMHKSRVCDLMITLNVIETNGEREVSLFVAKNRLGESRFTVGPLPVAFEVGRLVY